MYGHPPVTRVLVKVIKDPEIRHPCIQCQPLMVTLHSEGRLNDQVLVGVE